MPSYLRRRTRAASLLAAAIALVTALFVPPPALAAQPGTHTAAATSAGQWLSGQLVDGGMPGFAGTDWGLTIDVLIALAATGADPAAESLVADTLADNVDAYATGGDWAPDLRFGGATAKLLYASVAAGRDPRDFGGHDLRSRTLDLIAGAEAGQRHGWLMDHDGAGLVGGGNMFDQSLAVLGLARSGGVPPPVVDFLISQQCPGGGFRLFPPADGAPCAAADPAERLMDPDTTGMAVQALLGAADAGVPGAGAAAAGGVAWLLSVQRSSGAFHGSALTDFPNTNSSGLAGIALVAAGEAAAAGRAADWVSGQQLTPANAGAAAAHTGAIAYTPDALTGAAANGISEPALDQWRRSTAQAALVLAQIPLSEIGITAPPSPGPSTSPEPSAAPTGGPNSEPSPEASGGPNPPAGAGGGLPVTGAPVATLWALGGLALAAGTALLLLATRRRREHG